MGKKKHRYPKRLFVKDTGKEVSFDCVAEEFMFRLPLELEDEAIIGVYVLESVQVASTPVMLKPVK